MRIRSTIPTPRSPSWTGAGTRTEAARLAIAKAETFGEPQYQAARRDWPRTAGLFDRLTDLEARIAPSI